MLKASSSENYLSLDQPLLLQVPLRLSLVKAADHITDFLQTAHLSKEEYNLYVFSRILYVLIRRIVYILISLFSLLVALGILIGPAKEILLCLCRDIPLHQG